MPTIARPLLVLLTLLFAAPALAQGDGDTALQRRQPAEPGFEEQVDGVFGSLISAFSFLPFYDIASWLGIDTTPPRLVGDNGRPAPTTTSFETVAEGVELAVFTRTGRRVLAAGTDHAITVFSMFRARWHDERPEDLDVPDERMARLTGHTDTVTSLTMFPDPDGRIGETDAFYRNAEFLSASRDGTARIWRLCSEAEQQVPTTTAPVETVERTARQVLDHGAPVTAAVYSTSGRWVATGGTGGAVTLWDARCQPAHRITGIEGGVAAIAFHDDDLLRVTPVTGAARWFTSTGEAASAPEEDADDDAERYHGKSVTNAAIELQDGTRLPLPAGTAGGALGPDETRALSWDGDGVVRVHEWLVRGPTDQLATVGVPFVVLWLVVAAVFFTLFFRFVNLRLFKHAVHCVSGRFSNPADQGEVSHFQALSAALSATVGLGNIAGVAIAVMIGGPGATFWMIIAGLLGMTLKFTECTLGQKFRKIGPDGAVLGGPMIYLRDGLRQRGLGGLGVVLAIVFSIFCLGGSVAGGNAFQVNQSLGILRGQVDFFDHNPWVYGVVMAFFVGIVIIGGIKAIARVAEKIVPTMCAVYVLSSLALILMFVGEVPAAFGRIFDSALTGDAVYGGAIGALIQGFRRAAFSNEAGVGSASIAHSAARTPFAVREGIVALLEPFIDTVVVCTITALVIGITGVYNAPENAEIIASTNGAALTAAAFASVEAFRAWFPWVLMVAVVLFAYSTMISWSYYGERCATSLWGPRASLPFKLVFLGFTVLGSIVTATNVLEFGDLMILLMAFPNILGLYFLKGLVRQDLSDYEGMLQAGEIKAFK